MQELERQQWDIGLDGVIDGAIDIEMDVPVDFGDSEHEERLNDLTESPEMTIRPHGHNVTEDGDDRTRFWDITVPIRETSVLSLPTDSGIIRTENPISICNGPQHADTPARQHIAPTSAASFCILGSAKPSTAEVRQRNDDPPDCATSAKNPLSTWSPDSPVEQSRGLKLSKLGVGMKDMSPIQGEAVLMDDVDVMEEVDDTEGCVRIRALGMPKGVTAEPEEEPTEEEAEVDYASRVPKLSPVLPPGAVGYQGGSGFRALSTSSRTTSSILDPDDPLGLKRAEKCIKGEWICRLSSTRADAIGERPRTYWATSSPTPPPPLRALSPMSYTSSPSSGFSIISAISVAEQSVQKIYEPRRGIWKGGRKSAQPGRRRYLSDTPDNTDGDDVVGINVKKVFIEPLYTAVRASP